MKKFMKFAAMAAAVLALCVACEEKEEAPSLEGKQWMCEYVIKYSPLTTCPAVMDLGATLPGKLIRNMAEDGTTYTEHIYGPNDYTIEPIDATSGVIIIDTEYGEERYGYSELTNTSVKFSPIEVDGFEPLFELNYKNAATVAKSKIAVAYTPVEEDAE